MANITFTIDDAKIPRIIAAMKGIYPIPKDENDNPLFTDNQWAKEALRRWVVETVQRYENVVAKKAAEVATDDSIIS